jgi:hypothetical protein
MLHRAKTECAVWVTAALLSLTIVTGNASAGVDGYDAAATVAAALDSVAAGGFGTSAWGEIPAPSDSTVATFRNRNRSAWEWPLYIPYAAINYPLRWIREGFGKSVIWADRKDLFRYVGLVPVPRGVVPLLAYNGQAGFSIGANVYFILGSEINPVRLRATYSTQAWQKYTAGTILNKGGKWELHLGGGYRLRPNLEYYGIGPNSSVDDLSFFRDERAWGGINLRRKLTRRSRLALVAAYSAVSANLPSAGNDPSVPERFGDDTPTGFGERSEGAMARFALFYNSSKEEGNPDGGTIVAATAGGFVATNNDELSFTAYRFEFQQFFPLWHTKRALALRGYLNFIDNTGTVEIPFQRMFVDEVPDKFRGYPTGRWRDVGITGVNVEYRYPFASDSRDRGFGIDAVLMYDAGQVFGDRSDITVGNLTHSYGFGLRAFMDRYYIGALGISWSDEGYEIRLSTKQLYQYSRDVLFQGREETLIH